MAINRLQRALERLEAHRLDLERQIISEMEEMFIKDGDDPAITDYHAPSIVVPWQVFGDEHSATEGDTPHSITWLDTN